MVLHRRGAAADLQRAERKGKSVVDRPQTLALSVHRKRACARSRRASYLVLRTTRGRKSITTESWSRYTFFKKRKKKGGRKSEVRVYVYQLANFGIVSAAFHQHVSASWRSSWMHLGARAGGRIRAQVLLDAICRKCRDAELESYRDSGR